MAWHSICNPAGLDLVAVLAQSLKHCHNHLLRDIWSRLHSALRAAARPGPERLVGPGTGRLVRLRWGAVERRAHRAGRPRVAAVRLARAGNSTLFVSNNSRCVRPELALRFGRLGFSGLRVEQLFSSALCAARLLCQRRLCLGRLTRRAPCSCWAVSGCAPCSWARTSTSSPG